MTAPYEFCKFEGNTDGKISVAADHWWCIFHWVCHFPVYAGFHMPGVREQTCVSMEGDEFWDSAKHLWKQRNRFKSGGLIQWEYSTAGLTRTLCSTSKQPSFLYFWHFKQSLTKPISAEEWPSLALVSSPALKLWAVEIDLSPGREGATWKLILVWVPEKSGASVISAVPLYLLSAVITFSCSRCGSFQSKTDSGNFLF